MRTNMRLPIQTCGFDDLLNRPNRVQLSLRKLCRSKTRMRQFQNLRSVRINESESRRSRPKTNIIACYFMCSVIASKCSGQFTKVKATQPQFKLPNKERRTEGLTENLQKRSRSFEIYCLWGIKYEKFGRAGKQTSRICLRKNKNRKWREKRNKNETNSVIMRSCFMKRLAK